MKQKSIHSETWLDLSDAARYLGVHFTTLRRWADAGEISFIRTPGGRRRFSLKALEAFLQQHQEGETSLSAATQQPLTERAVVLARASVQDISNTETWMSRLNDDQRLILRGTGNRLMALLLQYNSRSDGGEAFLEEGKRIARQYSQICAQVGLSLRETVHVFLYFRRSVLDAIHETDHLDGEVIDNHRLYHRTTNFLDGMLLDLIGSYPGIP